MTRIREFAALALMLAVFAPEASAGPRALLSDLVVDSVTLLPDAPQPGQPVVLRVRIKNIGPAAAGASSVSIDAQGSSTVFAIPALDPGAEANISKVLRPGPGKTAVQVRADSAGVVVETNEANNAKSVIIETEAPKPDLVLAGFGAVPLSTGPAGSVRLTATVVNAGPGASPSASIVLRAGNEAAPPALPVSALQPGAKVTIERTVVIPGSDPKFQATATVDPAGAVAETNESNNTSQGIFWTRANADLAFQAVRAAPTAPIEGGNAVLYATVINQGSVPSVSCTATLKLSTEASTPPITVPALTPGASVTVARPLVGISAGSYTVKGTLDTTNVIAELDESNNTIDFNLVVQPRP